MEKSYRYFVSSSIQNRDKSYHGPCTFQILFVDNLLMYLIKVVNPENKNMTFYRKFCFLF